MKKMLLAATLGILLYACSTTKNELPQIGKGLTIQLDSTKPIVIIYYPAPPPFNSIKL